MSVDTFLQLAEQGGFLDSKTVKKLRKNLSSSSKTVTAVELAEMLIRRNELSPEQSASLLQATQRAEGEELSLQQDDFDLRPARRESDTRKSLDVMDEDPDENVTLLSAQPVKPTGFLQDGPLASDGRGQVDEAPVPNLTPVEHDDYRMISDSGVDSLMDDNLEVAGSTGVIAAVRELFRRNKYKGQRWDSSLMMIGGGTLLFLILAGAALYFVLTVGSGDEYFQLAEEDYKSQLYAQAIQKYDRFINRFPRHNKVSLAKVRKGLAHMRSDVEAENWEAALRSVQTRLEQIRSEPDFSKARPELAGILPDVYAGFVDLAEQTQSADGKETQLAQAEATFALISDPDYLPSSQRRQIQSRIDGIDERIEKVRRDIDRQREVTSTVTKIEQAVADGDSAAAYRQRDALLERYPGAQKNTRFQDAVIRITAAEQRSVKVSTEAVAAATDDRSTPTLRKVALSARRAGEAVALDEKTLYTLARGGLYAIEGRTGKVLWRRWLGFQSFTLPVALDGSGADVIAIDHRHGDLMRLDAATGQLRWRASVGPTPSATVVWDEYLLQVNSEGKLFWTDATDGTMQRTATFPQALTAPPGVDRQDHLLFQPGNHSTLYVLDADTFKCVQAVFIGHSDGMISVAPTVTKDHVFVIENGATDYCRLHVLARGRQGQLKKIGKPIRLRGIVVDPPITYGRNMLIATDRGAIYVLESDAANVQEPVQVFAQIHPRNQRTSDHFGLLSGDRILISGTGLSEYEINSARGELTRKWTEHLEDIHLAAPELVGDTLFTRRRSPAAGDVIVEATRIPPANATGEAPQSLWTTRIAAPPAGPPIVLSAQRKILVTARNGSSWSVDTAAFRDGLMERRLDPKPSPVASVIPIGPSGVVFASADTRPIWRYAAGDAMEGKTVALGAVQNRLSTVPVRFAEGLLVCTTTGPIHYVAADTGQPLGDSFQMPLARDASIRWLRPAADGNVAWVATDDGRVQRLELTANGLLATASADFKTELVGSPAVAGDALYLVARTRKGDSIIAAARDTLQVLEKFPVTARVIAGPTPVGSRTMIATADDRWLALGDDADGKPQRQWEESLPLGSLAGAPIVQDGTWICTAQEGKVFRIDAATGKLLPWSTGETGDESSIDLGEPLGSGAVLYNRLLLISGSEGTLYATPLPEASP